MKKILDIKALIEGAKNGETKQQNELMKRYEKAVRKFIQRRVSNENDVDDLVMEVFTKAFINLESYNYKYSFSTWLFSIATNSCVDFDRKREKQITTESIEPGMDALVSTPEDDLIDKQNYEEIEKVLSKLTKRQSAILRMRHIKGQSYKSIAEELNTSVDSVRIRLYRSKKAFIKAYKNSLTKSK